VRLDPDQLAELADLVADASPLAYRRRLPQAGLSMRRRWLPVFRGARAWHAWSFCPFVGPLVPK
jgi:hypothetical protein